MLNWQKLLHQAEHFLNVDRPGDALQLCDRASFVGDDARYRAALLRGRILLEVGNPLDALSSFESVASIEGRDAELDCFRGIALFELAQFPEAEAALRAAVREDPTLGDAYYTLALIAELVGTGEEGRWFREARKLEPERFAFRPQLTNGDFQAIIEEAVSNMSQQFQKTLEEIPIVVAELPLVNDLHQLDPKISPLSLAMMVGTFVGETPQDGLQPVLFLFKRNVERAFRSRDEMLTAIRGAIVSHFADALGVEPTKPQF